MRSTLTNNQIEINENSSAVNALLQDAYFKGQQDLIMSLEVQTLNEPYPTGEMEFDFEEVVAIIGSKKSRSRGWHLGYKRRDWSEKDVILLKEMVRRKYTPTHIAELLDRTRNAIYSKTKSIS